MCLEDLEETENYNYEFEADSSSSYSSSSSDSSSIGSENIESGKRRRRQVEGVNSFNPIRNKICDCQPDTVIDINKQTPTRLIPSRTISPSPILSTQTNSLVYDVLTFYNCYNECKGQGQCSKSCGDGGACCHPSWVNETLDQNKRCNDKQIMSIKSYAEKSCHDGHRCVYVAGLECILLQ